MARDHMMSEESAGMAVRPSRRRMMVGGLVIIALALVYLAFFSNRLAGVDGSRWQAVFLTNNQVYFGRLSGASGDSVKLTNVYYLQVTQQLQQGAETPQLNLVKLGSELHGPDDAMYIPKGNILFWENMKNDSPVVQRIAETRPQQ